jgi:hypothetical protein
MLYFECGHFRPCTFCRPVLIRLLSGINFILQGLPFPYSMDSCKAHISRVSLAFELLLPLSVASIFAKYPKQVGKSPSGIGMKYLCTCLPIYF